MMFLNKSEQYKLIESEEWPNAINPKLICKHYEDEIKKAQAIIELMIDESLENKDFLQISLNTPYCEEIAPNYGANTSHGIDLSKCKLNIKQKYDIILLFDVLDHVNDFQNVIEEVKNNIKPNGFIYIRFHPFNSRLATHDYKLNKAYSHLLLNRRPLHHNGPKNYEKLISDNKFKILYERKYPIKLEDFFVKGKGKIISNLNPETVQFIDYKLICI